ncbi:hypothetical protein PHYSODRAFT_484056, partial [Phytophthora sojae]
LENLQSIIIFDGGAWCCNGFLGDYDLSDTKCGVYLVWGTPAGVYLNAAAKSTARAIKTLQEFSWDFPDEELCYSIRFMGCSCSPMPYNIDMRRCQILSNT